MPWHVAKSGQCPVSKPWAVIKDSDGSVDGRCHPTEDAALAQLAALYANEPGAKMSTNPDLQNMAGIGQLRRAAIRGNPEARFTIGRARTQPFAGQIRSKIVKRGGHDFLRVEGYASVFDLEYEMYDMFGPYWESVHGDSFTKSLARDQLDVAFLVNHTGVTMARTRNDTLLLSADDHGLAVEGFLRMDRYDVQALASAIDSELIDEMSFAFMLNEGEWDMRFEHFQITEADIHRGDVSAVNYGASPYTSIASRGAQILPLLDQLPTGAARAAMHRLSQRPDMGDAPRLRFVPRSPVSDPAATDPAGAGSPGPAADRWPAGSREPGRMADRADARAEGARRDLSRLQRQAGLIRQLLDTGQITARADADEDPAQLLAGLDATLDQACALVAGTDHQALPAEVAQALDLLTAAEAAVDQLMELQGVFDPMDDEGARSAARAPHGAFDGTHSHPHPAYGAQGGDATHSHEHSHGGDDNHQHQHGNAAQLPGADPQRGLSVALALQMLDHDNTLDVDQDLAHSHS